MRLCQASEGYQISYLGINHPRQWPTVVYKLAAALYSVAKLNPGCTSHLSLFQTAHNNLILELSKKYL